MKKLILSIFVLGSFGIYVISQNFKSLSDVFVVPTTVTSSLDTNKTSNSVTTTTPVVKNPSSSNTGNKTVSPAPVVTPTQKKGLYTDGTYIGNSVDAYYGNVQVKVVISGGKLTDVIFLDHPQDRGTSISINNYAMPILKQEAISAQSANVDGVSGASATSPAFIESLTSALNQAKA